MIDFKFYIIIFFEVFLLSLFYFPYSCTSLSTQKLPPQLYLNINTKITNGNPNPNAHAQDSITILASAMLVVPVVALLALAFICPGLPTSRVRRALAVNHTALLVARPVEPLLAVAVAPQLVVLL